MNPLLLVAGSLAAYYLFIKNKSQVSVSQIAPTGQVNSVESVSFSIPSAPHLGTFHDFIKSELIYLSQEEAQAAMDRMVFAGSSGEILKGNLSDGKEVYFIKISQKVYAQ